MNPQSVEGRAQDLERSAVRFRLASLLSGYPPADLAARARVLTEAGELDPESLPAVLRELTDASVLELQSSYIDLFDRRQSGIPLYETEYGRGRALSKGVELADIAAFYRAFGLDLDADAELREMPDHLSVELEFYAWLLLKEAHLVRAHATDGASIVAEGRVKFMAAHLGPFAKAVASRTELETGSAYRVLLAWCTELVEAECAGLGIDAEPRPYVEAEREAEVMECGSAAFDAPGPKAGRLPVLPPSGE